MHAFHPGKNMYSLRETYKNRYLLEKSIRNDLRSKYAGQILGRWWIVLSPLILLAIYTVVYAYIFRLRPQNMEPMQYVVYIFCGLVPFLSMAESLNSGTNSITSNVSILKNITFPVIIIPIKATIIAHIPLLFSLLAVLIMDGAFSKLSIHLLFLPLIVLLQVIFLCGLSFFLSLLNVVVRDTANLVTYLIMLIMIASPIAYTQDMVPEKLRIFLTLNPFAYFFQMYQDTIALNKSPEPKTFLIAALLAIITFMAGERIFIKARKIVLNYV